MTTSTIVNGIAVFNKQISEGKFIVTLLGSSKDIHTIGLHLSHCVMVCFRATCGESVEIYNAEESTVISAESTLNDGYLQIEDSEQSSTSSPQPQSTCS